MNVSYQRKHARRVLAGFIISASIFFAVTTPLFVHEEQVISRFDVGYVRTSSIMLAYGAGIALLFLIILSIARGEGSEEITAWVESQKDCNSDKLFKEITRALKTLNADAGFLFETHRDIS